MLTPLGPSLGRGRHTVSTHAASAAEANSTPPTRSSLGLGTVREPTLCGALCQLQGWPVNLTPAANIPILSCSAAGLDPRLGTLGSGWPQTSSRPANGSTWRGCSRPGRSGRSARGRAARRAGGQVGGAARAANGARIRPLRRMPRANRVIEQYGREARQPRPHDD